MWMSNKVLTCLFRGEGCAARTPHTHLESGGVVVGDKNSLCSFGEQMRWRWVIKSPTTHLEAWAVRTLCAGMESREGDG
jgi:hypothetical protein